MPAIAHARQRLERHRVNPTEDRGVRAKSQRQRKHDDGRHHRRPRDHAQREAEIAPEVVQPRQPPGVARALLDLLDAAELPLRRMARVARAQATLLVLRRLQLQVRAYLLGHLDVEFFLAEEGAEFGSPAHDFYSHRNATIGSTFVARRAGMNAASKITPSNNPNTPMSVADGNAPAP